MYHSLRFFEFDDSTPIKNAKNTWTDWHLVPASRPVFNPPSLKEHITDIPGKDGVLDFTEALTGYPMFERREGTFEFIVMNGYQEWYQLYSEIMAYLHGKILRVNLEDEPSYYYEGRFVVQEWKSEKDYSRITLAYKVDPYKWLITPTDFVRTLRDSAGMRQTFVNLNPAQDIFGAAATYPTAIVENGSVQIVYYGLDDSGVYVEKTETLTEGSHELVDCPIRKGDMVRVLEYDWISGSPVTVTTRVRKGGL